MKVYTTTTLNHVYTRDGIFHLARRKVASMCYNETTDNRYNEHTNQTFLTSNIGLGTGWLEGLSPHIMLVKGVVYP